MLVKQDPKGKPTVDAEVAEQNPAICPIKFAGHGLPQQAQHDTPIGHET